MPALSALAAFLVRALRARPVASWAALGLFLVGLGLLPSDPVTQPWLATCYRQPAVAALIDVLRPFGRGEVGILLALALAAMGRRRRAVQLATALIVMGVLVWLFKLGVDRVRPNDGAHSFVSGDTATAWTIALFLLPRRWLPLAVVGAIGVGLGRVLQGYHFPGDVCAGAGVGLLGGVLGAALAPERLARWPRRVWLGIAAAGWLGLGIAAWVSPKLADLRMFLLIGSPAVVLAVLLARWRVRPPVLDHRLPWLVGGAVVLLLLVASASSLWDRDEPRNALAACEMQAKDAWLVPTFNGAWRLHKPILAYWLMRGALTLPIPFDLACRLPAVLCTGFLLVLTALTARRLGRRSGLSPPSLGTLSVLALAASPLLIVSATAATTDAALLAGLALAQWGIITLLIDGPSAGRILAAGLGIGLALLAKGPMGLLVPGATLAVAAITCRDLRPRAGGWVALGAAFALGCACFLAWAIPANLATDGAFLREGLGDHVVQRGMEARESHGGRFWISLPYYLPILLVALLACLPGAVIGLIALVRGRILGHAGRWLLVGWTVPAFLAISIFATKLPHYLLPAVPALAILAAAGVMMAERDGIGAAWRWALRIQVAILVLLAVGLGLALPVTAILGGMGLVPNLPPLAGVIAGGLAAAAALLVGVAALWSVRRRPLTSQLVASLAIAGWLVAVATVALPEIEPLKPAPRLAAFIQRTVPAGTPIATCGYDEPSLYAYLGPARGPIRNLASASDLVAWAAEPGPGVAVVLASRLTEAEAAGDLGLTELQRETGVNYSKNHRPIVVVVLERGRR